MSKVILPEYIAKLNDDVALPVHVKSNGGAGLPAHVAIIMDGNGRWAERRGKPRVFGHIHGCSRVREIIREATRLKLKALTLYAFSTENWGRPEEEVTLLMRLLHKWLEREKKELMDKNIRFRPIGSVNELPAKVQAIVREVENISRSNTGLQLNIALSYGSREELVQVAQRLARKAVSGEILPENIDEQSISQELTTSDVGDPDLLIRTSGEVRISNFLLWQLAYTELYFTETMWPDFRVADFHKALDSSLKRQRRFGLTTAQIEARV